MSRLAIYFGVWAALVAAAVIIRFSVLAGTTSETRFPLGVAVMFLTFAILAGTGIYENRRLALLGGLRDRGTFGYLRGWVKSVHAEWGLDDSQVQNEAERQFRVFRIASVYAFASLIVVVPVLVF